MNPVPLIPDSAPFSPAQRAWLNGFFAGLISRANAAAQTAAPAAQPALTPLTILFGSQTGTAEGLARKTSKTASARGFAPTMVDMGDMTPEKLAGERNVLIITSTYGEGEPPDNAKALWEAVGNDSCPKLPDLRFSVLSLGDTNYTQFCQCGKDFDARLEKRGATRVTPRVDCDLDYEDNFNSWLESALTALSGSESTGEKAPESAPASTESPAKPDKPEVGTRKNPFAGRLIESTPLNASGSSKDTRHVVIHLGEDGPTYEAGDALGVFPQNCPESVDEILTALGCDGEEAVPTPNGEETTLRRALLLHYDIGRPPKELLRAATARITVGTGEKSSWPELQATALPETPRDFADFVNGREVIDVLTACPNTAFSATEFVGFLKKLQPRLYSIASSLKAHPSEVHLTVGTVRYECHGRPRKGVCSTFLADRATENAELPVFVHRNKAFKLPADPATPVIMVGPGTGIAPFRSFLEERKASGSRGKNWLFFGDQHAATDYLYREELEALQKEGALTRLDLAFSRDQKQKLYVQHRMIENARDLFAWIDAGAYFYVCGDASRMAKDVDTALHTVIEKGGSKTPEEAADYVKTMRSEKRYLRDVY